MPIRCGGGSGSDRSPRARSTRSSATWRAGQLRQRGVFRQHFMRRSRRETVSLLLGSPNQRGGYAAAAMPSKLFQPGLLDGQVAIVSGGGSGLGRASALELAALGARVVVCGRREEPLAETAARADGDRVEAQACDIREEEQVEALIDGVLERHGRIDLLV